jgi:hypothetical protein
MLKSALHGEYALVVALIAFGRGSTVPFAYVPSGRESLAPCMGEC